MIGGEKRRFETRHEMAVAERRVGDSFEPVVLELVEIDVGPGTGVEPWYAIRAWRTRSAGTYPFDVTCPLDRAQAGLLWREATGGMEIGDGERAAEARDRRRKRRQNRRVALSLALFFAGCAAFGAALWAVPLGMYWEAIASAGAGGIALWLWCGIEEGWL